MPGQVKIHLFLLTQIFIYFFIYLFLAALGLRCCVWAFSSCGEPGLLSSCGAGAQLLLSMWDLPGPGLEPMSPSLAGRFSTTAPPGKSLIYFLSLLPSAVPGV